MVKGLKLLAMLMALIATLIVVQSPKNAFAEDKTNRTYKMFGTDLDHNARGEIAVHNEYKNGTIVEQKIEIDVKKLAHHADFRLFIDGVDSASFTTDGDGKAKVEIKSQLKGSHDSRPASLPDAGIVEVRTIEGDIVLTSVR